MTFNIPARVCTVLITGIIIFCLTANVSYAEVSGSEDIVNDQVGSSELTEEVINSFGHLLL